jgi:hypothetical protein
VLHRCPLFPTIALLASISMFSTACDRLRGERPVIVGRALDGFGRPVAGAALRIQNSGYAARTAADGTFSIEYAPGTFELLLAANNCLPLTTSLTIATPVRYAFGTRMLVCPPALPPDRVVVVGRDRFVELQRTRLNLETVERDDHPRFTCLETQLPLQTTFPSLTGRELVTWLPPQAVDVLGDRNFVLARAEGQVLSKEGNMGALGPPCPNVLHVNGTMGDSIYAGRRLHVAQNLVAGTYCFIRGARFQMPVPLAEEGYCFEWRPNPSADRGPVYAEPAPEETSNGMDCTPDAQGRIPCTEVCYGEAARPAPPRDRNDEPDFSADRGRTCFGP